MGKKSSKTKSTTELPSWATPLATGAGNQILNTVSSNQGNLQSIANGIQGQLPGLAKQAFGQQPGLAQGQQYIKGTLGGQYLNSNPYTQAMAKMAGQDALNGVNSSFSMAGRTGGGNNIERAAQGVAQAENGVLFQNYQNERGLQNQALGAIPGMVSAQYAGIPSYLAAAQTAGQLPYAGIQNLGQIGNLYGGAGTSSGTQPGGWGQQVLGAAASALPFLMSDRRVKKNIVKVGEASDGLGIYEYEYKFDPTNTRIRGVMADEVEKLRPEAFVPNFRGEYAGVNYAALGSLA